LVALAAVFASALTIAIAPATASDAGTFQKQAEAWCGWMGATQSTQEPGQAPWALGCASAAPHQGQPSAKAATEGKLRQDRAHAPIGALPTK
jgi:hypothetical protein